MESVTATRLLPTAAGRAHAASPPACSTALPGVAADTCTLGGSPAVTSTAIEPASLWSPPGPGNVVRPGVVPIGAAPNGMILAQPRTIQLPDMGKWMYAKDGQPADWLGMKVQGKTLREPINMIFIDAGATSAAEATQRITEGRAPCTPLRRGAGGRHGDRYQ